MERTGATIGATFVRQHLGYDGSGIGVAIVDSGVTSWHDDLGGFGGQRVVEFVDFVNGRTSSYDDYGHGTHVAGIVAGNGFDSNGARSGIAPGARLMVLKVLDGG
jgi:serine protease AprX